MDARRSVNFYQNSRNGYWYVRFTEGTGRARRRRDQALGVRTEPGRALPPRVLERYEQQYQWPFVLGDLDPFREAAPTVAEAAAEFLTLRAGRERTQETYRTILELFAAHVGAATRLEDLRRDDVAGFLARGSARGKAGGALGQALSPRTRAKDLRHLAAFLRWCARREDERGVAAPYLEDAERLLPRLRAEHTAPSVLLPADYRRLQAAARARYAARQAQRRSGREILWMLDVWDFLLGSGLRKGEARAAQVQDVRGETAQIWVGSKSRERDGADFQLKGTREHYAHLHPLAFDVARRASEGRPARAPLLTNPAGEAFSYGQLSRRLAPLAEAARLRAFDVHGFRHAYVSWSLVLGWPAPIVSAWLGHATTATTMRYWQQVEAVVTPALRRRLVAELLDLGFVAP